MIKRTVTSANKRAALELRKKHISRYIEVHKMIEELGSRSAVAKMLGITITRVSQLEEKYQQAKKEGLIE